MPIYCPIDETAARHEREQEMKEAVTALFRMHETLDGCPFSQQRMLNQNGIYFQISSSPCGSVKRVSRTFSPERSRHVTSLSPHETSPEKAAGLEYGYKFPADFDNIVLTGNTARRRKLSPAMLRIIRSLHWISFSYGRSDNLSDACASI